MKRVVTVLLLFAAMVVKAQDTLRIEPQDQERQKIEISQLPMPVRTALESDDYANWTVSSAYRSTQTESSDETKSMEVYVVELKKGADIQVVKFDKDGVKLSEDIQEDLYH